MSRKRATQAELIKRREEIQELILKGTSSTKIQELMSEKWDTSKRAISEDLKAIAKDWESKTTETSQLMRNKYADRLEMLFNRALQEGHIKTALEIQKEVHKLNALYAEKDVDSEKLPEFINIAKKGELKVVGDDNE